jgi:acyl carrier protein
MDTYDTLRVILEETLQIGDRAQSLDADTPLLGHLPELDSMAVVEVVTSIEVKFSITVHDDEVNAEVFESFGSLAAFIDEKRQA